MRKLWLVFPLALGLAGCDGHAGKKPNETPCKTDGECTSDYCECASACRQGCCRTRPAEPVMCTMNCNDVPCGESKQRLSGR